MKMQSTTGGQKRFAQAPSVSAPRSVFDRSSGLKTTFDSGYLVPIFVDEAVPGDTMNLRTNTFARMSTPIHPVMDNMRLTIHYWSVPVRLVWENWQKMHGEQDNPGDSISYGVPQVTPDDGPGGVYVSNELFDYLGLPPGISGITNSALFSRAYNLIWNEHYRDENLQQSVVVDKGDGPDSVLDYVLLKRGKRHDYFTSCLPWPQKGDPVSLPVGTGDVIRDPATDGIPTFDIGDAGNTHWLQGGNLAGNGANWTDGIGATPLGDAYWNDPKLTVDFDAITINEMRQSFAFQKILERDARGGTRYIEMIKSHFGVTSDDARLQRPEFLGGHTQTISATPVPQTSETSGSPQGNLAAYATSSSSGRGFVKSFTEHCVILGFACVTADLNYQQGLPRMFSRHTRYDFYLPSLAHLGEQAVLNKEIYADGGVNDDLVFGYQERWAEMRYKPSVTTGLMRSQHPSSLDTWHLAQEFTSVPILGGAFIQEDPPIDRVVAVPSEPEFLFDAFFELKHARPMPAYSIPGFIDRF